MKRIFAYPYRLDLALPLKLCAKCGEEMQGETVLDMRMVCRGCQENEPRWIIKSNCIVS